MEVEVKYVVDLDEVPREVEGLLPDKIEFRKELEDLQNELSRDNITGTLGAIESIRRSMYHLDRRLADCQSILNGYLGVKSGSTSEPQPAPEFDIEKLTGPLSEILQPSDETHHTVEHGEEDDSLN